MRNTISDGLKKYRKYFKKTYRPYYKAFGYASWWSEATLAKDVLTAGCPAFLGGVLESWHSGDRGFP